MNTFKLDFIKIKKKNLFLQKTLREWEYKQQTGRSYLQNKSKKLYIEYLKSTKRKKQHNFKMSQHSNRHITEKNIHLEISIRRDAHITCH